MTSLSDLLKAVTEGEEDERLKSAKIVLKKDKNLVKERDADYQTPLHRAVYAYPPSVKIVRLLLQKGADVNAVQSAGKTPLFIALYNKLAYTHDPKVSQTMDKIIKILLKANANVNVFGSVSGGFKEPLFEVALRIGDIKLIKLLIKYNVDLSQKSLQDLHYDHEVIISGHPIETRVKLLNIILEKQRLQRPKYYQKLLNVLEYQKKNQARFARKYDIMIRDVKNKLTTVLELLSRIPKDQQKEIFNNAFPPSSP